MPNLHSLPTPNCESRRKRARKKNSKSGKNCEPVPEFDKRQPNSSESDSYDRFCGEDGILKIELLKCYMLLELELTVSDLEAQIDVYEQSMVLPSTKGRAILQIAQCQQKIQCLQMSIDKAQMRFCQNMELIEKGHPVDRLCVINPNYPPVVVADQTDQVWRMIKDEQMEDKRMDAVTDGGAVKFGIDFENNGPRSDLTNLDQIAECPFPIRVTPELLGRVTPELLGTPEAFCQTVTEDVGTKELIATFPIDRQKSFAATSKAILPIADDLANLITEGSNFHVKKKEMKLSSARKEESKEEAADMTSKSKILMNTEKLHIISERKLQTLSEDKPPEFRTVHEDDAAIVAVMKAPDLSSTNAATLGIDYDDAIFVSGSEDEESTASPRSDHVADLVALEVIPDRGEVVEIDHIPDSQFPDTTIDIPALELAERFDDEKFGSQLSPDSGMGFVKPSDSDRTDNSSSSCTSLDRYEKKFEPAEQVVEITQTQHSVENDYRLACELAEEFSLKGETEDEEDGEWHTIEKKQKKRKPTKNEEPCAVRKRDPRVECTSYILDKGICATYYKLGSCPYGNTCKFSHVKDTTSNPKDHVDVLPPTNPLVNELFTGERQIRKKTSMCKSYQEGKCGWGSLCNYAHNKEELAEARRKLHAAEKTPTTAKSGSDNGIVSNQKTTDSVNETTLTNASRATHSRSYKTMLCKSFELGKCPMTSDECKYAHAITEINPALRHDEPCDKQFCVGRLRYERRKTDLCPKRGGNKCEWLPDCKYAHSEKELRQLSKKELCQKLFGRTRKCIFPSSQCPYAHSKDELRSKSISPSSSGTQNSSTDSATTTQLSDHEEPCTKQFCPGRLRYEKYRTSMCAAGNKCKNRSTCQSAHNSEELRPLPKLQNCSKHWGSKNCGPSSQCPYVHELSERRHTPSVKSVMVTGAATKSLAITASKPASSTAEAIAEVLDSECYICKDQLSKKSKKALDCSHNHDSWHLECIKRWVDDRSSTCPLCREPVSQISAMPLPAGLDPRDFPKLPMFYD